MPSSDERVVRRTLADGTIKDYRYPRVPAAISQRVQPGSLDALIAAFRLSPEWAALRPATVKNYSHFLRDLDGLGAQPAGAIRRRGLLGLRDAIATTRGPGAANVAMRVWATLFRWARDRGWIEHNPADRVRALPGGHLLAWTAAEADHAAAVLPEELRRVVLLARYTGQRRGDLIAMTWAAYNGAAIRLVQQKTRMPLRVPVHPNLKAMLTSWRHATTGLYILTEPTGRPWTANHLTHSMHMALKAAGMRDGLNVHGLRKLAAMSLAEAGCSAHEIAAITGHRTLAMVALYTASADQERLAEAAILRLKTASEKTPKNGG